MKKAETEIKTIAQELLDLLDVKEAKVTIKKEENNSFGLSIETPDSGILIGFHGENLYALQLILSLIAYKKTGVWQRIIVDVGGWRAKREEQLKRMALAAAQKAKFSQEALVMPYLNAAERRVIHLVLADHPDIVTRSEGKGNERRLVVEPKQD